MEFLLIEVESGRIDQVVGAVRAAAPKAQIRLMTEKPLVAPRKNVPDDQEELVGRIVAAVRPRARTALRREALEFALFGMDTQFEGGAEADPSLRNGLGALSKAMRPIFPHDASPIDRLATRTKHFCPDTGIYLGTKYSPTALGLAVRRALQGLGELSGN